MNKIITLDQLADQLAKHAGISIDEAREAILALQQNISDDLTGPSGVSAISHIGEFRVTDSTTGDVTFTADKAISDIINEPFSFFEPVQVYSDQLEAEDSTPEHEVAEATLQPQPEPAIEPVESATIQETAEVEPVPVRYHYTVPVDDEKPASTARPEPQAEPVQTEPMQAENIQSQPESAPRYYSDETEDVEEPESHHGMNPLVAYILGILTGMILMCVAVYFLYPPLNLAGDDEEFYLDDEVTLATDSAETTTPEPAPAQDETKTTNTPTPASKPAAKTDGVITDTVSSTNYLAIMARKYYGNTEFWVYIYKENEAILGHPDRVPAGTVVVIPPASKYGIDANDPESIRRAKKLNGPIYAPYK